MNHTTLVGLGGLFCSLAPGRPLPARSAPRALARSPLAPAPSGRSLLSRLFLSFSPLSRVVGLRNKRGSDIIMKTTWSLRRLWLKGFVPAGRGLYTPSLAAAALPLRFGVIQKTNIYIYIYIYRLLYIGPLCIRHFIWIHICIEFYI